MKFAGIAAAAALAVLALALPGSPGSSQVNSRGERQVEWYLTPDENPCLVETLHVTGSVELRLHVVINPGGGYSWQMMWTTKMMAVGLDTGETYRYNGPMSSIENGRTDDPWMTWYPITWTSHNINHFEGPGQLPNLYVRSLTHTTYDRTTGGIKIEVFKEDVLCR